MGRGVQWNEPPELPKKTAKNTDAIKSKEPVRLHHDDLDYRSYESQEITRSYDEESLEIKAHILGTEETSDAEAAFYNWLVSHPSVIGARLKQTNVKHLGGGVHEALQPNHQTAPRGCFNPHTLSHNRTNSPHCPRLCEQFTRCLNGPPPDFVC